ncbi:hypothetical protein [Clostridium septicum]|uniref:Uncharacterized protein n=1 Tax=Clostridium septicum TaxID=1504 RepID=A0A9N7PLE6_CLOSE|nr:hypothetical protein [Clostridium septicum]AYE33797.1 hypothetical protein CP523_04575 [Clostridium septicum]MDU1314815.1 hypothetical protein [Clostridium septicum]QAS61954.1 hypothetical protein EI377_15125 [Clostridium septicum]UEC21589.1 hypothetical protein LK444_04250 [Clostridium septicum]USS00363.1 hypothetical protein NH397_12830 [Clostridium septicum]
MDIILEELFTLVLDGCFEIITNKKINSIIRKIVFWFITSFYMGIVIIFTMLAIKSNSIVVKIIYMVISMLFLLFFSRLGIKLYKNKIT